MLETMYSQPIQRTIRRRNSRRKVTRAVELEGDELCLVCAGRPEGGHAVVSDGLRWWSAFGWVGRVRVVSVDRGGTIGENKYVVKSMRGRKKIQA